MEYRNNKRLYKTNVCITAYCFLAFCFLAYCFFWKYLPKKGFLSFKTAVRSSSYFFTFAYPHAVRRGSCTGRTSGMHLFIHCHVLAMGFNQLIAHAADIIDIQLCRSMGIQHSCLVNVVLIPCPRSFNGKQL